jgi:hypothetical protein
MMQLRNERRLLKSASVTGAVSVGAVSFHVLHHFLLLLQKNLQTPVAFAGSKLLKQNVGNI